MEGMESPSSLQYGLVSVLLGDRLWSGNVSSGLGLDKHNCSE